MKNLDCSNMPELNVPRGRFKHVASAICTALYVVHNMQCSECNLFYAPCSLNFCTLHSSAFLGCISLLKWHFNQFAPPFNGRALFKLILLSQFPYNLLSLIAGKCQLTSNLSRLYDSTEFPNYSVCPNYTLCVGLSARRLPFWPTGFPTLHGVMLHWLPPPDAIINQLSVKFEKL